MKKPYLSASILINEGLDCPTDEQVADELGWEYSMNELYAHEYSEERENWGHFPGEYQDGPEFELDFDPGIDDPYLHCDDDPDCHDLCFD